MTVPLAKLSGFGFSDAPLKHHWKKVEDLMEQIHVSFVHFSPCRIRHFSFLLKLNNRQVQQIALLVKRWMDGCLAILRPF